MGRAEISVLPLKLPPLRHLSGGSGSRMVKATVEGGFFVTVAWFPPVTTQGILRTRLPV
jgi:hypothetical protein